MGPLRLAVCASVLLGIFISTGAFAQGFPSKPVRIVMPLPAGSETDVFARVFAKQLSDGWNQQVLVENRPGAGTTIATEALRAATGIDIVHIPYKGTSLAVLDVLPGRVALLGTILPEALPYIKTGKLRVLAITSPKRAPSLPDIPTVTESVPAYKVGAGFWLLITRAGTPPAVMNRLNAGSLKALQSAEVRKRLATADIEYIGSTPEQCDAFVREQVAVWGEIVKTSGARVD